MSIIETPDRTPGHDQYIPALDSRSILLLQILGNLGEIPGWKHWHRMTPFQRQAYRQIAEQINEVNGIRLDKYEAIR